MRRAWGGPFRKTADRGGPLSKNSGRFRPSMASICSVGRGKVRRAHADPGGRVDQGPNRRPAHVAILAHVAVGARI